MTDKPKKVETLSKETPFQGFFRLDSYTLRHELFEGGMSDDMSREVFERGHAVAVVPYDPVRDELVMIEQFRSGAFAALSSRFYDDDERPWLAEFVAGMIGDDEDLEDVARREVEEETGCTAQDMEFMFRYLATPGGSSETLFLYCARVDATGAGGIHGLDHEHEDIRVYTVPALEAVSWLDRGAEPPLRIDNSNTLLALYWFRDNRDRLRRQWA